MEHSYLTNFDDSRSSRREVPASTGKKEEHQYTAVNLANRKLKNPKLLRKKSLHALRNALQHSVDVTGFKQFSGTASVEFPKEELTALLKKWKSLPENNNNVINNIVLSEDDYCKGDANLASISSANDYICSIPRVSNNEESIEIKSMVHGTSRLLDDSQDILRNSALAEEHKSGFNSLLTEFRSDVKAIVDTAEKIKVDLGNPVDWNAQYRNIMEIRPKTIEQKLEKFKSIAKLTQEFEYTAQMYGKIIISEVFWQNKYRTIRPLAVGGSAGGEKFVYNGILFKFAVDWKKIYKNDRAAMKAASHEMLSMMSIQDADIEGIYTPLMCLIDYLGFRLVAISLLPVSRDTLIYGSDDGGHTVRAKNADLNQKMIQLGRKLNLAEHLAGITTPRTLSMPVDIEGHLR